MVVGPLRGKRGIVPDRVLARFSLRPSWVPQPADFPARESPAARRPSAPKFAQRVMAPRRQYPRDSPNEPGTPTRASLSYLAGAGTRAEPPPRRRRPQFFHPAIVIFRAKTSNGVIATASAPGAIRSQSRHRNSQCHSWCWMAVLDGGLRQTAGTLRNPSDLSDAGAERKAWWTGIQKERFRRLPRIASARPFGQAPGLRPHCPNPAQFAIFFYSPAVVCGRIF
jgi:hypothetical protein